MANAQDRVNVMFDRVDILDSPLHKRKSITILEDQLDFDPEDEYFNESQASGLHPAYSGFDDPDEEDPDADYLYLE